MVTVRPCLPCIHPWSRLTLLALLAATALAAGATSPALQRMLPDDPAPGEAPSTTPPVNGAAHVAALKADADHGELFLVTRTQGDLSSPRVVFLVPQFHRSPLLPILWSSLGEAISQIQENVDTVVTRLVVRHGVRCVGTEGSPSDVIPRSHEIEEVAGWQVQLANQAAALRTHFGRTHPELPAAADTVNTLVDPYLRRQVRTLDGVGMALARRPGVEVLRFGLEDAALNRRALDLLGRIRPREEERARLLPESQPDMEDAMGQMWHSEYPAFDREVLAPLRTALGTLDAARKDALREDAELDAAALARFSGLARTVLDATLRPDDVTSYMTYYDEVSRGPTDGGAALPARVLNAREKKRLAALERELARLQTQYDDVAGRQREVAAVKRTLARLGRAGGTCILVMGANHEDGLLKALAEQGGKSLAVVVVQPYDLGDGEAADGGR